MALSYFRIGRGIEIRSDDFSTETQILNGDGAPGSSVDTNAAPIGTIYMDALAATDDLNVWWKYRSTQNDVTDWRQTASKDYVDNLLLTGTSWREPVLVLDNTTYANITAAESIANFANAVGGIAITAGDRILFTDLTAGNDNVYIVSGVNGAWTFTEAANSASDGDALLVQEGIFSEQQWIYDGADWIQMSTPTTSPELGFIRDFIGKNAVGAETPGYSSTNIITANVSLEAAIGELDAGFGSGIYTENNFVVNAGTITANLDAIDVQIGTGLHPGGFNILTTNDITENLTSLDVAIGDLQFTNNTYLTDGLSVTANLNALGDELGNEVTSGFWINPVNTVNANLDALDIQLGNATFTPSLVLTDGLSVTASLDELNVRLGDAQYTADFVVTDGQSVTASIDAIDQQLQLVSQQTQVFQFANVSTQTVVDSHLLAEVDVAKWIVSAENSADPLNRISVEVHALHNGVVSDHNEYSVQQIGANIAGIALDVDVSGGLMRLLVNSTTPVDVSVKRLAAHSIN